ncbi:hypothetical protein V5O48_011133 [Marasmius crinis-equi]|uniref:EF-hand domain-containing protein n=1 Tax=Marasmius crinis-equi TaxID=585013 RepID=A0ABR3F6R6_9AGAR
MASTSSLLLDEEGGITELFEICLKRIFAKYCTPSPSNPLELPEDAYISPGGLDRWAIDTNGEPFSKETKDELLEFMDVNEQGDLTFKGFLQVYQLQTENDEEETWRDLSRHGFDRSLAFNGSS